LTREAIEMELQPNNMNREDVLCLSRSWKPLIHFLKYVQPPAQGVSCPNGQLVPPVRCVSPRPPFAGIVPVPAKAQQRADFYPISLPHYTSLSSTVDRTPSAIVLLPHLSSPIRHWSAKVYMDHRLYITCYPFAHGLFIVLMMEAVRISETLINLNVTTRRYIPEDSKLQISSCILLLSWKEGIASGDTVFILTFMKPR
jgi:hypothetical protein